MKTRMELWKEYRESIEKNTSLLKAVDSSNEKLRILYKRLLEVYPNYENVYKSELLQFEAAVDKINQAPEIPMDEIERFLEELNEIEMNETSVISSINNISFSSSELEHTLKLLEERRKESFKFFEIEIESDGVFEMNEVNLGGRVSKLRIAIDGPSGSGKSTVAKQIAKMYHMKYINTGLVYRAIALFAIKNSIDINNESKIVETLKDIKIQMHKNEMINLNGEEVTKELRSDIVSKNASVAASYKDVREFAVDIQKAEGSQPGVIMDGRDTTFKIMPDADIKIFLDTSAEVRANRRLEQNRELGYSTDYEEILKDITERDFRDRNREVDPLHKTKDAILIDASKMTIQEVVKQIEDIIENK